MVSAVPCVVKGSELTMLSGSEVRSLMAKACKAALTQQQQQFLQNEIAKDPKLVRARRPYAA